MSVNEVTGDEGAGDGADLTVNTAGATVATMGDVSANGILKCQPFETCRWEPNP